METEAELMKKVNALLNGQEETHFKSHDSTLEQFLEKIKTYESELEQIRRAPLDLFEQEHPQGGSIFKTETFFPNLGKLTLSHFALCSEIYLGLNHAGKGWRELKEAADKTPQVGYTLRTGLADLKYKILERSARSHVEICEKLPILLEDAIKIVSLYNDYLSDRFVKDEQATDEKKEMLMLTKPSKPKLAEYVKIKLVDDNPVLTDLLLNLAESIPKFKTRTIQTNDGSKTKKELSKFTLAKSVDLFVRASDKKLQEYVRNPNDFFTYIAETAQKFIDIFFELKNYQDGLQKHPELLLHADNPFELQRIIEEAVPKINAQVRKLNSLDVADIHQEEDEYLPNNRKETDYFELRDKQLAKIQETLDEIGKEPDLVKKDEIAREAIIGLAELRHEIDSVLISNEEKRLREDKKTDNEYYEGTQGEIGCFKFERKPTPNTSLDKVIGASFDAAKKHLMEIVKTGTYPKLMELSSPGRKVRSNILLIGPYGCGKTEIARAICADPRVIGATVSVAGTLTAYMHESVNNVRRIYDDAKKLFVQGRELKPVILILDEFDSWFVQDKSYGSTDMQQIQTTLQQILDGMGNYNGIITLAMTNEPHKIPKGIMRRFRYVDVVGELNEKERIIILKQYLESSLPYGSDLEEHYLAWAKQLKDAPGDVIRKVVDELHFEAIPAFIAKNPEQAEELEKELKKRETDSGTLSDQDVTWLQSKLRGYFTISQEKISAAIDEVLSRPAVQQQITVARDLYENTQQLKQDLGMGWKKGSAWEKAIGF